MLSKEAAIDIPLVSGMLQSPSVMSMMRKGALGRPAIPGMPEARTPLPLLSTAARLMCACGSGFFPTLPHHDDRQVLWEADAMSL